MDQPLQQRVRRQQGSRILKAVRSCAEGRGATPADLARRSGMSLSSVRKLLGVGKAVTSGAHLVALERLMDALELTWEVRDAGGRLVAAGAPPQSLEDLAASLGVRIEITPITPLRRK